MNRDFTNCLKLLIKAALQWINTFITMITTFAIIIIFFCSNGRLTSQEVGVWDTFLKTLLVYRDL